MCGDFCYPACMRMFLFCHYPQNCYLKTNYLQAVTVHRKNSLARERFQDIKWDTLLLSELFLLHSMLTHQRKQVTSSSLVVN